jgi:general nucleoside transport system permease protein
MKITTKPILKSLDLSNVLTPVAGTLLGVIVGISFVIPEGSNIFSVLGMIYTGAFGSMYNFFESLVYAIPLGITGLAIALSYKSGVFNIGCEGQIHLGAAAATFIATSINVPSSFLHITLCLIAGAAAGALWAYIPGYLKAKKGFSEIVVTMLMNYIAILFIGFLVQNPLRDKAGVFPHSALLPDTARLSKLMRGSTLHQGIWIFLALVIVVYILLFRTKLGFKIRGVGLNPQGARYAGMNVSRIIIISMLFSGALAGIAGGIEIMGVHYRLMEGFSPGYGFDAIAVALLVDLNPFGIIISSLFFGALRNAANSLQIDLGIPVSFVYIIQGLAILFVLGSREMPRFINSIKRRVHLA